VLFVANCFGQPLSALVDHQSDEVILLAAFGTVLLVAGLAQRLQVSAAIGAGMLTSAVDCAGIGWVLAAALGDDPSGAGQSDADGIASPIE
jgi:hypothetical protein